MSKTSFLIGFFITLIIIIIEDLVVCIPGFNTLFNNATGNNLAVMSFFPDMILINLFQLPIGIFIGGIMCEAKIALDKIGGKQQ